jgi:hypothetical protein
MSKIRIEMSVHRDVSDALVNAVVSNIPQPLVVETSPYLRQYVVMEQSH